MITTANKKHISSVAVVVGGWSDETNYASSPWVVDGLLKLGLNVSVFDIRDNDLASKLQNSKADIIFPTCLGAYGEDGKLQGFLETAVIDIPYVGSGVAASALGMNKLLSKLVFIGMGIPVANYIFLAKGERITYAHVQEQLGNRFVIKPACSGASIGFSMVRNEKEFLEGMRIARGEECDILLEQYLKSSKPYTEYAVGILEDDVSVHVLPVCEIASHGMYTTEKKSSGSEHIIPARLPRSMATHMQDIATRIFHVFGCSGFVRVDMIITRDENGEEKPYVLEINSLPGLIPKLIFPEMCAAAHISYTQMLTMLLKSACKQKRMESGRKYTHLPKLPASFKKILPKLPQELALANYLIDPTYGKKRTRKK